MRELILDFAFGETDTSDEFIRNVDDCSDLHRDIFAFLMVLSLWRPHLVLIAADKQGSNMVRVRELPTVLARG